MSVLRGRVGDRKIVWKKAPIGSEGVGEVEVDGKTYTVGWRRDSDGLVIELSHGCFGFDLVGEIDDAVGTVFRIAGRGNDRVAYGLRFRGDGEAAASVAAGGKKSIRVRAQMPGKIVRVLVAPGEDVEKGQPLLVMEAMKMENEIRAAAAGKVESVKVVEGQAVESGADLILIG